MNHPGQDTREHQMVDEFSLDGSGWARFSADRKKRFRLARSLVPGSTLAVNADHTVTFAMGGADLVRVVFLLINPSVADAFKPDRTVSKCMLFAQKWGAHILEVVNLFTLISPYPTDLDRAASAVMQSNSALLNYAVGTDIDANREILSACMGAKRVIAGWGNNGDRWGRDIEVMQMLQRWNVPLECLGLTGEDHPLHPLARGKAFIPLDREPVRFPVVESDGASA